MKAIATLTQTVFYLPALVMCALVLLAGCGGGGGDPEPLVTRLELGYLVYDVVTPEGATHLTGHESHPPAWPSVAAMVGDRLKLSARADGRLSGDPPTTWHSSNEAVATVEGQRWEALLTTVGPGTAQITVSYGSLATEPLQVTVIAGAPTATYWPLVAGNQWVYYKRAGAFGAEIRVTAQEQTVREGMVWWVLEVEQLTISYKLLLNPKFLRQDERGLRELYYVLQGSRYVPHYRYLLQGPLAAGTRWVDPDHADHYWDLVSTTDSVTVGAGSYVDCLHVREYDGTHGRDYTHSWFAPAVGRVRAQTFLNSDTDPRDLQSEDELTSAGLAR